MNVVSKSTLAKFWAKYPDAKGPLEAWYAVVSKAEWSDTHNVRATYGSADFVGDNRIVFNIGGNKYRLIVHVSYAYKSVLVKFIGTHARYNEIDAGTVDEH